MLSLYRVKCAPILYSNISQLLQNSFCVFCDKQHSHILCCSTKIYNGGGGHYYYYRDIRSSQLSDLFYYAVSLSLSLPSFNNHTAIYINHYYKLLFIQVIILYYSTLYPPLFCTCFCDYKKKLPAIPLQHHSPNSSTTLILY